MVYLKWILANEGIDELRSRFKRLCEQKPNSLEFYFTYYQMELAQSTTDAESIRHCFEQALFDHGVQSVEVWLKYVEFELKSKEGDPAAVSKIYERAIKFLEGGKIEEFIKEYVLLTKE
jgi:hypothetical protein